MKNIYAIAPESNYCEILAKEILAIVQNDFNRLAEAQIFMPSRRASAYLKNMFLKISGKDALFMPSIHALGDIDETELELNEFQADLTAQDVGATIPSHIRLLTLARIIRNAGVFGYDMNNLSMHQALKLAKSLAEIIDDLERFNLEDNNLSQIFTEELAKHSQISLSFLNYIQSEYPKEIAKLGYIDAIKKRNILIDRYLDLLQKSPPKNDIIIAGTLGTLPHTKKLIKTVLGFKTGHYFLPYFDYNLEQKDFDDLLENGKSNHQYHLAEILKYLDVRKDEVRIIIPDKKLISGEISHIYSANINYATKTSTSNLQDSLSLIETENNIEEAKLIGAIIREKLEEGKVCAVITNNTSLANLTKNYLKKWNINADYSAGQQFSATEEGNFILQIADFLTSKNNISKFISLLNNRFSLQDHKPKEKEFLIKELEKTCRDNNLFNLSELKSKNLILDNEYKFINEIVNVLDEVNKSYKIDIKNAFRNLVAVAKILSENDNIFLEENFSEASELLNYLLNNHSNEELIETEYLPNTARTFFENITIRPKFGINSKVCIISPIEARLLNFNCVILAGVNHNSWPSDRFSIWLSDNMKHQAKLPSTEFFYSLSAHDFTSHLHNKEVFITRSKKENGEITVESPFISRILAYFNANNLTINRAEKYSEYLKLLEKPSERKLPQKPYPKPAIELRPKKLSVTDIENLIYNPYQFYVKKILKLRKLDDLEREVENRDYGNFIHKVLENFTNYHQLDKNKITSNEFLKIAAETLNEYQAKNIASPEWVENCKSFAEDFIRIELERLENLKNIFCERKGSIELEIGGEVFNINCKADRIEITNDNKFIIADYKTGEIPKAIELTNLKKPQLLVESIILEEGGFDDALEQSKKEKTVSQILYYKIAKSKDAPKTLEHTPDIEATLNELKNLLHDYINSEKPFLISPREELKTKFDDFWHLQRSSLL